MEISLNGQPRTFPTELSLTALLAEIGLQGKPVVIELNGQPVLASNYDSTTVNDQARLEIITLAAGG